MRAVMAPGFCSDASCIDFARTASACRPCLRSSAPEATNAAYSPRECPAATWQGKRLNAPNDIVVHPDGDIWFTDPGYGTLMDYEGHKGELLLKEAVYRVAKDSGIPQSSLATVVSGRRSLSAETAMRLGMYFGMDAQFWLNLQTRYDLMMLDDKRPQIEKEVHPLPKAA